MHLTTASRGQFSESGFHLLAGEARTIEFAAWEEFGVFDGGAENGMFFECFPYVCPEPVLAK